MPLADDDTNSILADRVNPNHTWIDRENLMHNVDEEITKGVSRQGGGGVLWSVKLGDHRTCLFDKIRLFIFICFTNHHLYFQ